MDDWQARLRELLDLRQIRTRLTQCAADYLFLSALQALADEAHAETEEADGRDTQVEVSDD